MAKIINFNLFRKKREREDAVKGASKKRARAGIAKAQRQRDKHDSERKARDHENKCLD